MRPAGGAVAFVAALTLVPGATASMPEPPLVRVAAGAVGSARPGQSLLQLTGSFGPPGRIVPALPGGSYAAAAVWDRAVATFGDTAETRADSILYRGAIRTVRGDRIGSSLAAVRRHWRLRAATAPADALPGYVELRVRRVWFVFDPKKRLAGVRLGTPSALALGTFR